jgi:hypothetical protein
VVGVNLGKYLKAAFANRWNLLAFLGGMGFAFLSVPDVAVPLVLAAELTYLGLLGTHPKFQSYVDAQEAKSQRSQSNVQAEETLRQIMDELPKPLLARYKSLRDRCLELRKIALDLKNPGRGEPRLPLDEFHVAGLDRLLWIYLRLLYSRHALGRFLEQTSEKSLKFDIESLTERLATIEASYPDPGQRERIQRTLEDNLATCRDRLANYQKAQGNFELLELELDRLEAKIQSLSELAVNRQEPDFISGQVDQVASSMIETERTMNELEFATGLHAVDEEAPRLLERPMLKQRG